MELFKKQNDIQMYKYLTKEEIEVLNSNHVEEKYLKDEIIIEYGERNRDVYFVAKGSVSVWIPEEGDEMRKITSLPPGTMIGENNFVMPVRRSATIKAESEETLIFRYSYLKLQKLLLDNPIIAAKFFAAINDSISEKYINTINRFRTSQCMK